MVPGAMITLWPYSDGHCDTGYTKSSDNKCYMCGLGNKPNAAKNGCEVDTSPLACSIQ
jgi:hypothetical protein